MPRRLEREPTTYVERVCATCGVTFSREVYASKVRFRGYAAKYCSAECYRKRHEQTSRPCLVCQAPIYRKGTNRYPSFCSQACRKVGHGMVPREMCESTCRCCGKTFSRKMSKREKDKSGAKFCSATCYNQFRLDARTQCLVCHKTIDGKSQNKGFCSQACYFEFQKAGRVPRIDGGYVQFWTPEHPSAQGRRSKYVAEHRLVMERMLGRYLTEDESVHHRDGNRGNNDPANLELWCRPQPTGTRVDDLYGQDVNRLLQHITVLEARLAEREAQQKES